MTYEVSVTRDETWRVPTDTTAPTDRGCMIAAEPTPHSSGQRAPARRRDRRCINSRPRAITPTRMSDPTNG